MVAEQSRQLFDYWRRLRRGDGLTRKSDFDPTDVPRLLPFLYLWQLDEDRRDFTGRLFGSVFVDFAGADFKGRKFREVHGAQAEAMFENHLFCLEQVTPFVVVRHVHAFPKDYLGYEATILPLVDGQARPALLIGSLSPLASSAAALNRAGAAPGGNIGYYLRET